MSAERFSWVERLNRIPRWARAGILVAMHIVLFSIAYGGAFLLRFDFEIPPQFQQAMWKGLLPMLAVKLLVFGGLRMFQGWWKYVSLYDVVTLTRALIAATGAWLAVNVFWLTSMGMPRSIYLLDLALCLLLLGGARGSLRLFRENVANRLGQRPKVPVLIAGAGDTGEILIRELTRNRNLSYRAVGLLDDDHFKHGLRVHGVPVLGPIDTLPMHVEKHGIEEVIIAMPSATRAEIRRVVDLARRADVKARIVPAFEAIVEGDISLNQLRDVAITDLLGRSPVRLNTAAIGRFLEGRRVLVTGAGGSIGSEICRQVMRFNPKGLILADIAETPLFFIHRELHNASPEGAEERLFPEILDVTNARRVEEVFQKYRPDVVLHAAAYKHVPLMEKHPSEAVANNVQGTKIVAELASAYGADTFVLISTDKAVNPTSVMGATKRAAELLVRRLAREGTSTKFCAVRFGNVLGSNGSVIPIFRSQIERGGPLTVTHPEMTRYFMTIPEATQLVLQAASFNSGELFILDMGEPVKILDLAKDMIRLSGLSEEEMPIKFTGVRPGEKLFEELALDMEQVTRTEHEKIFVCNGEGEAPEVDLKGLEKLLAAAENGEDEKVLAQLHRLIPTYGRDHRDEAADKVVELAKRRAG